MKIVLPPEVMDLCQVHSRLKARYSDTGLTFTLDGKLVGDIGEAIVAKAFGLRLCANRTPGVDAHTPDGRSVQIKATGRSSAGPAFTPGEGIADHLLFIQIDFNAGVATVAYNGPEAPVRKLLPANWGRGTKVLSLSQIKALDATVSDVDRLAMVEGLKSP